MSPDTPRVLITCDGRIPSVELGAIIPFSELQKRGLCQFRYKDEISLSLADIAWCDIVFIVRGMSSVALWYTQKAKELGRKVLGYWDDDLLGIPEYSLMYAYASSPEVRKTMIAIVQMSHVFFAPNHKLAKKLSSIRGDEVKLLPVPLGVEKLSPPQYRHTTTPVVGYAGGIDHVKLLSSFLVPALAATASSGTSFKVHIVGPRPDSFGSLPQDTTYTPHISNYYDYLAFATKLNWDIGLAPQWEHEFTTYKFYNKLLEYTQIGCAGIYTRIEPYTTVIQDGITGSLVPNEIDAWRDAIIRLIKDPELRYRIARNAYEFVIANHNWDVVAEGYVQALAPFLNYKAPRVSRTYLVTAELAGKFTRLWQLGMEYIKAYGFWYVLRRAPNYILRMVARRP